ncbi:hypothetical protein, partial [Leptospira interrogans]|uniref:hypothetical protein n=1 Tax=Leptospira interrogans TaxID=173 RepID=UPI001B8AAAF7
ARSVEFILILKSYSTCGVGDDRERSVLVPRFNPFRIGAYRKRINQHFVATFTGIQSCREQ